MQYVRSISGSVTKTWNSINPATLSGAIDVIVIEQEDGSLACSPFHVRFGKFSLLRPYEKKVEFKVNNIRQNYSMKLGEGGEAFFVFETTENIPEALQTSPLISPASSPPNMSTGPMTPTMLTEPSFLDINEDSKKGPTPNGSPMKSVLPDYMGELVGSGARPSSSDAVSIDLTSGSWPGEERGLPPKLERSASEELLSTTALGALDTSYNTLYRREASAPLSDPLIGDPFEPPKSSKSLLLRPKEALNRAMTLSKKLSTSNIRSQVNESGDVMLDMTGYKTSDDDALRAEVVARKILSEELEGNYDIGSLIGTDENGNLWIYSSEEAKEAANRKGALRGMGHASASINDAASDPGYHSDSERSVSVILGTGAHQRSGSADLHVLTASETNRNYAKTLRLTSDQLKALKLKPGANPMSFTVNRATCQAYMYYWTHEVPIVISDIDGTITKSDALGHVLNMIGRDWTHIGVAKLYGDIVANGYNIFYLTSRSVGQADNEGVLEWSDSRGLQASQRPGYHESGSHYRGITAGDLPQKTRSIQNGVSQRYFELVSWQDESLLCWIRQQIHRCLELSHRQHSIVAHIYH